MTATSATQRVAPRRATPRFLRVVYYHASLYRRFWRGSIVTVLVSPIFFLLAMGVGVGGLVDDNGASGLGGRTYLEFVAPGLMAAAAMQTAMAGSMYPVLGSVKWLRTAYGHVATPVRPRDMALGLQTWLALQLLMGSTIFLIVMTVAGASRSPLALLAPPVAVLGGLAYSSWTAAWAIGRDGDESFAVVMRFGILPTFLLSGTFFPVDRLPSALAGLARLTPLWHAVELVRGLAAGSVEALAAVGHLAVLVAYASVGMAVGVREYRKRLYQ